MKISKSVIINKSSTFLQGIKPRRKIIRFHSSPQSRRRRDEVFPGHPAKRDSGAGWKVLDKKILRQLHQPLADSHKGDNGRLLIIGGSKRYHGAPLLAASIASKIVDLVYFSSVPENNQLIKKMKSALAEFIVVPRTSVLNQLKLVEAVLIGPGLGISQPTKVLVNKLLKKFPQTKFILDADALKVVDKKLLNKNCLLTPHQQEFKILFKKTATPMSVRQMSKKYHCLIVLKGPIDWVASPEEFKINRTGNAGLTKGGTGDVLAGLIAALACKNDLFLAASAGVYLNGLAGDRLKKKVGYYYSASDLIKEIPKTISWCLKSS